MRLFVQVGVAQEGGGDNVIEFQTCQGSSATLTDTSHLVDGHSYVVLLKVKRLTNDGNDDNNDDYGKETDIQRQLDRLEDTKL